MILDHPHHQPSFDWILKVRKKTIKGFISSHSLAECFSILTVLPVIPPIPPLNAKDIIRENVSSFFKIIELTSQDYQRAMDRVAEKGLKSGAIYDALIFESAIKAKADLLITWNLKDFQRLSSGGIQISTP